MQKIHLSRTWFFDEKKPLGEAGGFGEVFLGKDSLGKEVAIKRIKINASEKALREIRIAQKLIERRLSNVIQILDSGFDDQLCRYFIVMDKAEKSLNDELIRRKSIIEEESASILLEIVNGLLEVNEIVHRDLKPSNILYHEGKWKISDFGIAKFVEETTSTMTLNMYLSFAYAAPEQWNMDRVSEKTDVYSLGCIGYSLLTGASPFNCRDRNDFKRMHLYESPASLNLQNMNFSTLLKSMLLKNPESRPGKKQVKINLEKIIKIKEIQSSSNLLAKASEKVIDAMVRQDLNQAEIKNMKLNRINRGDEACKILYDISYELLNRIEEQSQIIERLLIVPFQKIIGSLPQFKIGVSLGNGLLIISCPFTREPYSQNAFPKSKWDIICGAEISVNQSSPPYIWSSSLWFTNLNIKTDYRWYEIPYWYTGYKLKDIYKYAPIAVSKEKDVDLANSFSVNSFQWCANPRPIDNDFFNEFVSRWSELFAKGSLGELKYPSHLPLEEIKKQ